MLRKIDKTNIIMLIGLTLLFVFMYVVSPKLETLGEESRAMAHKKVFNQADAQSTQAVVNNMKMEQTNHYKSAKTSNQDISELLFGNDLKALSWGLNQLI